MTNGSPESPTDIKPCVCLAMVVADNVIQEVATNKIYILGTFNRIHAPRYPMPHDRFHLYVAITDMLPGPHEGQIRIDYLDGSRTPLMDLTGPVVAKDRLEVHELNFGFRGIIFPKPGSLEISFYLDGQPIQARKFELLLSQEQEA